MSSELYQDAGAHRIKRKPPPPFPYSARYPEPDPTNPFAPLSVLRDRTATLTNPAYESPVAIPDPTPGSPNVLDLPTFIMRQRNKSAALGSLSGESGWNGHVSQLRKGASMGLGLYDHSPNTQFPVAATITSSTLRPGAREVQRREARRRSQSVFALRSGTFSFLETRAGPEPQLNVESPKPTRRHSLSPFGSRTSVLSYSSASSGGSAYGERKTGGTPPRPRSCSSSFVSATLLDGVPENLGDGVQLRKSMHVMDVDILSNRCAKSSDTPLQIPPPALEKRTPSVSSIGSWSRDLAFYPAPSRPQTPSSIRSSRPVSLPPSSVLSFPRVPVNLPPAKQALFTTSPVSTSPHHAATIPSTLVTSLPPSISNSRRTSTSPEDLDTLPIQVHFRFPKQEQSAESEPESVGRESGRFARLRARTSMALQARRSSTSSSLRSTLRAAAEAADKLAAEDASIAASSIVTLPRKVTAQTRVIVPGISETTSLNTKTPLEPQRVPQTGGGGNGAEQLAPPPSITHAHPPKNTDSDGVLATSCTQVTADIAHRDPQKTEVKTESESAPSPKRRSASRSSHKITAKRSSSTPLPLSRPLPSPPTVTTHPEPMVKLSYVPPPRSHSLGLSHPQYQRLPLAPTSSVHSEPSPRSHAVHVAHPATPHASLPVGAATPHVVHEPALLLPHTIHRAPSSQMNHFPLPRPPPRSVQTIPQPSRTPHALASNAMRSTSSNSSRADNMSMASTPQLQRRDPSPSSLHGRQSSLPERHGHDHHHHHHHHHHHPQNQGNSRSLSDPGTVETLSSAQLTQAACMPVVRENGLRLQFGELWRTQRTVVIFVRHFWCATVLSKAMHVVLTAPH